MLHGRNLLDWQGCEELAARKYLNRPAMMPTTAASVGLIVGGGAVAAPPAAD
jgi:hypothetical protein